MPAAIALGFRWMRWGHREAFSRVFELGFQVLVRLHDINIRSGYVHKRTAHFSVDRFLKVDNVIWIDRPLYRFILWEDSGQFYERHHSPRFPLLSDTIRFARPLRHSLLDALHSS